MGEKKASEIGDALRDFIWDFSQETDRAAVVLGAAQLDILLYQLLQRFLLPSATSKDELLDSDTSLGTFCAKINAAFRLGLIDSELARALHLIRKIRNAFAHETASKELSFGAHRDRVRELVGPFKLFPTWKQICSGSDFEKFGGPSKNFRIALAITCARLFQAIEKVEPLSANSAMKLIPSYHKRYATKSKK